MKLFTIILIISIHGLFTPGFLLAQTTFSITKEGTSYTNDASTGSISFSNTANAATADGNRAVATTTINLLGTSKTNYLKVSNFGFSIPATATINSVTASVRKRAIGVFNVLNYVSDGEAKLIVGGNITGRNEATTTHWPNNDVVETYSFDVDNNDIPLSVSDVNSSNFGLAFSAAYTGVAGVVQSAEIDQIEMTVNYTLQPLPLKLISFSATVTNQGATLKWLTEEEEENATITLERSQNKMEWQPVVEERLHTSTGIREHVFHDKLTNNSVYYYRLKLTQANGKFSYSNVIMIKYTVPSTITLYPSPAKSFIIITNINKNEAIELYNIQHQLVKVPIKILNEKSKQLDIQHLLPGLYFVKAKEKTLRFIKE